MCSPTTPPSKPEITKRVRFHEKVKIVIIDRIEPALTEEMGNETATVSDDDIIVRDGNEGVTTSTLSFDVFSSCSSSNALSSYNTSSRVPIRRPQKIPSMLFNSLPLPTESLSSSSSSSSNNNNSSSKDRRWINRSNQRLPQPFSSLAPAAPVRALSLDQIIGSALAVIEGSCTLEAGCEQQQQKHKGKGVSRKNQSWDEYNLAVAERKRSWKEDSHPHSPPKVPRRKMSATCLEKLREE